MTTPIHTMPAPVDMHVHFRQGANLPGYVREHARMFEYALVMPNTHPDDPNGAILTVADMEKYRGQIEPHCGRMKPLMTIKLTPSTTPEMIREAAGKVFAFKLYPDSVTTNSGTGGFTYDMLTDGGERERTLWPLLEELQRWDIPLCVHGEMPDPKIGHRTYPPDRERLFVYTLRDMLRRHRNLRITLEHVTSRDGVDMVNTFPNCAGTITLQHLLYSANDMMGHKFHPHMFCAPMLKKDGDRDALRDAAFTGNPKFFLGSDSAPHQKERKECADCCAGCYTAPHLMEALAGLFHRMKPHRFEGMQRLKAFASDNARKWYGLPPASYTVSLQQAEWVVPKITAEGVVPLLGGQHMEWKATDA